MKNNKSFNFTDKEIDRYINLVLRGDSKISGDFNYQEMFELGKLIIQKITDEVLRIINEKISFIENTWDRNTAKEIIFELNELKEELNLNPQNRLNYPSIAERNQTDADAERVDGESNLTRSEASYGDLNNKGDEE